MHTFRLYGECRGGASIMLGRTNSARSNALCAVLGSAVDVTNTHHA